MDGFLSDQGIFMLMVFGAVFLLAQAFILPTFGENRQARKRLKQRLRSISGDSGAAGGMSLVRRRYLRELSPMERWLESLPGMDRLEYLIEQAGRETPAYRVVLRAIGLGTVAGVSLGYLSHRPLLGLAAGAVAAAVPLLRLMIARTKRLAKFEEQLPDALMIMARALRAGHPFTEALHLVSEEMQEPVSTEFGTTFMEVNYGGDLRAALAGLLSRIPSVTVMALVSSVSIQKETGGNLAELLDRLATVVRERFRFQRKLKTLSAEGRMAAWILSLMPFVLAGVLSLVSPNFLPMLTQDPAGRQLVVVAFVFMMIGILWLSRIVRIDV